MAKVVNSLRLGATASSLLRKRAPKRRKSSQKGRSAHIARRQLRLGKPTNSSRHLIAIRKKFEPRKAISALSKSISSPSSDVNDLKTSTLTRLQVSQTSCSKPLVSTPTLKPFLARSFDGQFAVNRIKRTVCMLRRTEIAQIIAVTSHALNGEERTARAAGRARSQRTGVKLHADR